MLVYIIEENRRIFDLLKDMQNGRYIFLDGAAEFSEDVQEYIERNGIIIFKAVSPGGGIDAGGRADLAVFGNIKGGADNIKFGAAKAFLLNIENIERLKNIDFGLSQIITCGLHEKDTIILSSIDADESSVMLELQRDIIGIKGDRVESFEKKIGLEVGAEADATEDILLALAVLVYCGRLEQ